MEKLGSKIIKYLKDYFFLRGDSLICGGKLQAGYN